MSSLIFKKNRISGLISRALDILVKDTNGIVGEENADISVQEMSDKVGEYIKDNNARLNNLENLRFELDGTTLYIKTPSYIDPEQGDENESDTE